MGLYQREYVFGDQVVTIFIFLDKNDNVWIKFTELVDFLQYQTIDDIQQYLTPDNILDWKKIQEIMGSLPTIKWNLSALFVNETVFNMLILHSTFPEAKHFNDWFNLIVPKLKNAQIFGPPSHFLQFQNKQLQTQLSQLFADMISKDKKYNISAKLKDAELSDAREKLQTLSKNIIGISSNIIKIPKNKNRQQFCRIFIHKTDNTKYAFVQTQYSNEKICNPYWESYYEFFHIPILPKEFNLLKRIESSLTQGRILYGLNDNIITTNVSLTPFLEEIQDEINSYIICLV
ncbi:putative Bro-N domain-containing protein 17 [Diachasmimorpha longicaudata entomopoxvirus]|uniref:Putative Bro-N domain-containing protein 17 n=1 Tax=Diachasmimorpha longicaudata entomopoxvirus TaxID=109981 RepID=A0A7R5WJC9_9POXV|nr:putative Bro-N domain-containing protein 17 [Diachasmimorpha longicaudata entomopoxvirus]AKS26413.1 putative Bro-N domain-containing protein 17 [Diachasmimorpha longicaudata entomopoxvirus]